MSFSMVWLSRQKSGNEISPEINDNDDDTIDKVRPEPHVQYRPHIQGDLVQPGKQQAAHYRKPGASDHN